MASITSGQDRVELRQKDSILWEKQRWKNKTNKQKKNKIKQNICNNDTKESMPSPKADSFLGLTDFLF